MSSPHLTVEPEVMSLRGLIFWAMIGALGLAGLASVMETDAPVMTLENSLGAEVETSRL
jgi:hypothetical protein